jgi:CDGSH-type Zn-finger protein
MSDGGARITAYPDGPLIVRGNFSLEDRIDGAIEADSVVALCRCGRSAVKPFCDGSHRRKRSGPIAATTATTTTTAGDDDDETR